MHISLCLEKELQEFSYSVYSKQSKMASSSNNTDSTNAPRIEDFGLVRSETEREKCSTEVIDYFLAGRSRRTIHYPEWKTFKIETLLEGQSQPTCINSYGVSALHDAYLSVYIQLTDPDTGARLTEMRHKDMLIANYNAACLSDPRYIPSESAPGASPAATLRYMCISNLITTESRATFRDVFDLTPDRDIRRQGIVELVPERDLTGSLDDQESYRGIVHRDPFLRSMYAMLRDHADEMGRPYVKRLCFVTEGVQDKNYPGMPPAADLYLHLVVELGRVGDSFDD